MVQRYSLPTFLHTHAPPRGFNPLHTQFSHSHTLTLSQLQRVSCKFKWLKPLGEHLCNAIDPDHTHTPPRGFNPLHTQLTHSHTSNGFQTHCNPLYSNPQYTPSYSLAHRLLMINAPITPGTQPQSVNSNTIMNEPHPLSITARGGKKIQMIARRIPMIRIFTSKNRGFRP